MKGVAAVLGLALMAAGCATMDGPVQYSAYMCTHTNFSERTQTGLDGTRYGSPWQSEGLARELTCPVPFVASDKPRELTITVRLKDGHSEAAIGAWLIEVDRDGNRRTIDKKATEKGAGLFDIVFTITPNPDTAGLHVKLDMPSRDGRSYSRLIGYRVE